MATEQGQPSLKEIVGMSFSEIEERRLWKRLSVSQILTVAASPLSERPRDTGELMAFGELANRRIRQIEKARDNMMRRFKELHLNKSTPASSQSIKSYFGKYDSLITNFSDFIEDSELPKPVREELNWYRDLVSAYGTAGAKLKPKKNDVENLKNTRVNLEYEYYSGANGGLLLLGKKLKADDRLAAKIPYYMINKLRKSEGGEGQHPGKLNRWRDLDLIDVDVKKVVDIGGLLAVADSKKSVFRLFRSLLPHSDVRCLRVESYYGDEMLPAVDDRFPYKIKECGPESKGPYHALHADLIFDPGQQYAYHPELFVESAEMIFTDLLSFVNAHFGPGSYWRRINLQKEGIVSKQLDRHNRLIVDPFTSVEKEWKEMVEERILKVLSYKPAK